MTSSINLENSEKKKKDSQQMKNIKFRSTVKMTEREKGKTIEIKNEQ